jgi:hypothetical protein
MCVRIADLPRPGVSSVADRCAICRAPVWRSAASLAGSWRIECIPCALVEIEHAGGVAELMPAPYVAEDLRRRRLS